MKKIIEMIWSATLFEKSLGLAFGVLLAAAVASFYIFCKRGDARLAGNIFEWGLAAFFGLMGAALLLIFSATKHPILLIFFGLSIFSRVV